MKVWKLVSGILSIILFVFVSFQSCAAGVSNALEANGEASGSAGIIVAILMLAGGIVSIATRKSLGKGGNIALIVLFGLAAIIGFAGDVFLNFIPTGHKGNGCTHPLLHETGVCEVLRPMAALYGLDGCRYSH